MTPQRRAELLSDADVRQLLREQREACASAVSRAVREWSYPQLRVLTLAEVARDACVCGGGELADLAKGLCPPHVGGA